MSLVDIALVFGILFAIFVIVYSKVKNNDLKDTLDEVKEVVNPIIIK